MEQWEVLLRDCPTSKDTRFYSKVLKTAETVLKDDLAPFEIEWIVETLLVKPLSLLETISSERTDETWYKTIGDAFKVLTDIVTKHWRFIEPYYEDIMKLCLLSYDSITRKQAIQCIISMLERAAILFGDVKLHINALDEAKTCKAPLALLVGTICEYHDGEVSGEYQRIWKIYLKMLESNKNTVTVVSAVLKGILSLFNKFGEHLPMAELNNFYRVMSKEYIHMSRSDTVVFSILKHHANLFKENLVDDKSLRAHIWAVINQKIDKNAAQALRSIYETIFNIMDTSKIETILAAEVIPKSESNRTIVKYTALRVVTNAQLHHRVGASLTHNAESLEFELRNANVSYDVAEAVTWCIESNMKNSDRLLQAAIMFYDHFPPATRRDVVVNTTLYAAEHVRKAAVIFLINQSTQDASSVGKYQPLWTDLLQSPPDAATDNSGLVFEDAMNNLLDRFIDISKEHNELPSSLQPLLQLTALVLSLCGCSAQQACSVLLPLVLRLQLHGSSPAPLLSVLTAIVPHLHDDDLSCLTEIMNIDSCADEASLCEMLKLIVLSPEGVCDNYNLLQAIQIIVTRNDVEPTLLSKGLRKLENLLITQGGQLNRKVVYDIINKIKRLSSRKDLKGKEARILQRDVVIFLGKYGNSNDKDYCNEDSVSIVKMKDLLVFCLPSEAEGMNINIQRLVELAIDYEDAQALESLLSVIVSNWDTTLSRATKDRVATAQRIIVRLAHALCRTVSHGIARDRTPHVVQKAILMCVSVPAVQDILTCISEERSAGARRMLADCLEELLGSEQASSASGELLAAVCERLAAVLGGGHPNTVRAGLDIAATLITALKGNNDLTQKHLPQLLLNISRVHNRQGLATFKSAADAFLENLGLFDADTIKKLTMDLIKNQLCTEIQDINISKEVLMANLVFIKEVCDSDDVLQLILTEFEGTANSFALMAYAKSVFDYDLNVCRRILGHNDSEIVNKLFGFQVEDLYQWNVVFVFLKEYSVILLELQYEKTLNYIANLIRNIKPNTVVQLNRTLYACLTTYKYVLKKYPKALTSAYHEWCKNLGINNINVKNVIHAPAQIIVIGALKTFFNIFATTDLYETKKWTAALVDMYKTRRLSGFQLKMSVISDMLSVSVVLLTSTDIKFMLLNNKYGFEFCRLFIDVYFEKFIAKPYVLLEAGENCYCLLLDVVECYLKRKCPVDACGNVIELIDKLWPRFEEKASFNERQALLKHMYRFPDGISADSKPIQWAVRVLTAKDAEKHDKIRLIGLLPPLEEFSSCYLSYASCLPTRLSELHGDHSAMLRGLLDALAAQGQMTLFNIVATLAAGDDTAGWWDEALDSCMSALALKADAALVKAAYDKCWDGMSLGVCKRILVPLLRYSTPKFCEEFLASVISDLFGILRRGHRAPTASDAYHKCVVAYVKAFTVLQIVFEKVPPESLESANSVLHRCLENQKPWAVTSETCKLCVTLREKVVCPADVTDALRESCRLLQCASYNCLTAAICRRRPQESIYKFVFHAQTWANIVDDQHTYSLPLQPLWRHRSTQRHSVSIQSDESTSGVGSTSLTAATLRSRLYLRTLSENPLNYDMIENDEEDQEMVNQELQLIDSELNSHECSATLTALLDHVAKLEHTQWKDALNTALVSDMSTNAKWLLSQAICNTEVQLKQHSGTFRNALFQLIADTALTGDRILLNGLHIDLITVLTNWDENPEIPDKKYLNATVEYLISTCIGHRHSYSIYRSLLDALDRLLKVYGSMVNVSWDVFEQYFKDKPTNAPYYLQILQRLLKHRIYIPELVPTLVGEIKPKHWQSTFVLAEVFGQAINLCPPHEKAEYLVKFRGILDKIRAHNDGDYVKVLYATQKWCKNVCDERHFKIISDLAQKIEKTKCLSILSSNIEQFSSDRLLINDIVDTIDLCELIRSDGKSAIQVASAALSGMDDVYKRRVVMLLASQCNTNGHEVFDKAFQDILPSEESPPSKRLKTELTPLLDLIDSEDAYVRSVLESLGRCVLDGKVCALLQESLHTQLSIRFAESFFVAIYQPLVSKYDVGLTTCVSSLLEMLVQKIQLPEENREVNMPEAVPSKVVLLSSTYQGTFRSLSSAARHTGNHKIKNTKHVSTDIRMPVAEILGALLEFGKVNPDACSTLCVQIMKHLRCDSRGFDLDTIMSKQLARIITKNPSEVTPLVLESCRVFIDSLSKIDGFKGSVETLKQYTKGTEGEGLTTLLYEDLMLRCAGDVIFELGIENEEMYDINMEDEKFSLEDLIAAFGKLSNWDDLRIQDRRKLERELPVLYTDADDFKLRLDEYISTRNSNDLLWFDKMVTCYSDGGRQDSMRWLREIGKWPKRHFVASAVCEALCWQQRDDAETLRVNTDIASTDCRAEWAARLMLRSAFLSQRISAEDSQSSAISSHCRGQELEWCAAANRSGLPQAALQCIDRNKGNLRDNETLAWLHQKVLVLRTIGLNQRDEGVLMKALDTAEKYTTMFSEYSSPDVIIGMQKLILQLNYDLKSLSKPKLNSVMQEVAKYNSEYDGWTLSYNNAKILKSFYDHALIYYDESDNEDGNTDSLISSMSDTISCQISYNLTSKYDVLFSVILNKLESYDIELNEATARSLLDKLQSTIDNLDTFTIEHVNKLRNKFPPAILGEYPALMKAEENTADVCKQHLSLVADAAYTLLNYVTSLNTALKANDAETWRSTFDTMKANVFENPYAGSDYVWLTKYKKDLYKISDFSNTPQTSKTLRSIIGELSSKRPQNTIRLSQLCPALLSSDTLGKLSSGLRKLIAMPPNVTLVKFYEEVSVYTDSVRRPCVSRALLSNGRWVRFLHKRGDALALDAALQRCAALLPDLTTVAAFRGYSVTPLSQDSGMMEYLEDHERLRALIETAHRIDESVSRPDDNQLILSPTQSLQSYRQMCAKIPRYVLRSAIELHSTCVQDFIAKKRTFMETLSSMTIISWIFGAGDRHLENIMYNVRDGGACGVDWEALLQFGSRELPPARLTAALLAVCDTTLLESRLQNIMLSIKEQNKMFLSYVKQSFNWMGKDFDDKFAYIKDIVQTKTLPYKVTIDVLQKSKRIHKEKYVQLLEEVFERYELKDTYSIEEQISCLLQQCTDARILGVTRRGWQPWL